MPLAADRYIISLEAINNDTDKVGIYQLPVTVRDYTGSDLMMSDIVPAVEITRGHGRFYKEAAGLNVVPNPAPVVDRTKPLFLYFEVYNLTLDGRGRSRYEIRYGIQREKKKVLGLFGGGKAREIHQVTTKEANARTVFESIGLDVRDLKEGGVTIQIEIRDLLNHSETRSEVSLVLR